MMNSHRLSIPPDILADLFPFHIAFQRDMKICQVGHVINRLCSKLKCGEDFRDLFTIERPLVTAEFEHLVENQSQLYLVKSRDEDILLRGQMLYLAEQDAILFVCDPWLKNTEDLGKIGLRLNDFPIHSPVTDFLQLLQAQMMAAEDLKKLAARLSEQKETIRQTNADLLIQYQELEHSRAQTDAIFQTAPDGIITINSDGVIERVNPNAERLFGYEPGELNGQNVKVLMPEPHRSRHNGYIRNYLRTRIKHTIGLGLEVEALTKDGTKISIYLSVGEVVSGDRTHFTGILHDISDQKKAEEKLAQYSEKLEQMVEDRTRDLNEAQEELVNRAIEAGMIQVAAINLHNIGNAITPMNALMEILQTNELEGISRYLEKCYLDLKSHADDLDHYIKHDPRGRQIFAYMEELIHSLTDCNKKQVEIHRRIEGALSYISEILSLQQTYVSINHDMREIVDLNRLIEDAIKMQMGALEKRGIQVKKQFEDDLPKLLIDKNRFMQVIINFIKNSYEAIDLNKNKTDDKMIILRSIVKGDQVGLQILDTGIGVDPRQIDKIFEYGKSNKGSLGFGLHYCKRFVESNDGTLTFDSSGIGKGATISAYFNRAS